MFADSMLETSWAQRSRRSWMTLTSFGLQVLVVGLLLLLPLIRPVALPFMRPSATPISMTVPPGPLPMAQHERPTTVVQSNLADNVLIMPPEVPRDIAMIHETTAPPQISFSEVGVRDATGNGARDGVWKSIADSLNHVTLAPSAAPSPTVRVPRVSHMMEGNLIRRVQPAYPPLARSARIQGQVVLAAVITKEGTIENLRVLEGHPMLVRAALDAVSQWRYRPYVLNNEPVEVETRITVNFSLSGS
jgi:protein TonB